MCSSSGLEKVPQLFEDLQADDGTGKAAMGGKPRIEEPQWRQGTMSFEYLDDALERSYPARVIWDVLAKVDLGAFSRTQRQLLLRPDRETNNAFTYYLIEAVQQCQIEALLPCAMSNHHHTVIGLRTSSLATTCARGSRLGARGPVSRPYSVTALSSLHTQRLAKPGKREPRWCFRPERTGYEGSPMCR